MTTVPHVTSGSGLRKFQADGFLLDRVYNIEKAGELVLSHLTKEMPSKNILLTYLLTPWSRVLLEKLTGSAASQEIPRIFGTRRLITVPTSARHLSLS